MALSISIALHVEGMQIPILTNEPLKRYSKSITSSIYCSGIENMLLIGSPFL